MQSIDLQKLYAIAGEKAAVLGEELFALELFLRGEPKIKNFLLNVDMQASTRKEILDGLCRGKSPVFRQLLGLLLEKELLRELPLITGNYLALLKQEQNLDFAELKFAMPIDNQARDRIKTLISAKVVCKTSVDKDLIGGFHFMRTDWKKLDASVAGRLKALKAEITA